MYVFIYLCIGIRISYYKNNSTALKRKVNQQLTSQGLLFIDGVVRCRKKYTFKFV